MNEPARFLFAARNVHVRWSPNATRWVIERDASNVAHTMPSRDQAIRVATRTARREGLDLVVHDRASGRVVSRCAT